MFKKLAAATAGLAAALTLLSPSAAFAAYSDTGPQSRTVNPGQTVCVTNPGYAVQSARGFLQVTSGHAVRVTFGTPSRTIFDSFTPVSAAAPIVTNYSNPNAFPGSFKVCAVNQSLKVSNVVMQVILDPPY